MAPPAHSAAAGDAAAAANEEVSFVPFPLHELPAEPLPVEPAPEAGTIVTLTSAGICGCFVMKPGVPTPAAAAGIFLGVGSSSLLNGLCFEAREVRELCDIRVTDAMRASIEGIVARARATARRAER